MSILGDIFSKIFPSSHPAAAGPVTSSATTTATTAAPLSEVDVDAVLSQRAQQSGQKLNWQTSIVDLMKLLGLDSSLAARKQLAQELNYTGSTDDSATMNIWLQKQVMSKIAENGGKVPAGFARSA